MEKNEADLEKAISDMRELNLLYTGPKETQAQLDLNVMRTRRGKVFYVGHKTQFHSTLSLSCS